MKKNMKKIALIALLVTVAAVMAFAEAGRSIPFTFEFIDEIATGYKIEVNTVEETKAGIKIWYTNNHDYMVKKAVFYANVTYSDNTTQYSWNTDVAIAAGSTWSPQIKFPNPSKIKKVDIRVDYSIKHPKQETYRAPKEPKKDWVDRMFPQYKL